MCVGGGGGLRSQNELFVNNLFSRTVRVFYSSSFSRQVFTHVQPKKKKKKKKNNRGGQFPKIWKLQTKFQIDRVC